MYKITFFLMLTNVVL